MIWFGLTADLCSQAKPAALPWPPSQARFRSVEATPCRPLEGAMRGYERRMEVRYGLASLGAVLATTAALLAAVAAAPAATTKLRIAEDDSIPLQSSNVSLLATIPIGKPVGARFRDGLMYVTGTDGLTIYDVSKPELPVPKGALPLPHFENEDVDMGGNILLISNDPSEGVGVLYVIDITDPSVPKLLSATPNDFIETGIPPIFGLPEPQPAGIGHTISCVKPDCSYAYTAGTAQGIDIIDLTDPVHPKKVKRFKPDITDLASHDVQVDANGLAWIVGAGGTAAYDVTDPVNPVQVARTDESIKNSGQLGVPTISTQPVFDFKVGGEGETPIDLIHHNSLRLGELAPDPVVPTPPVAGETPAGPGPEQGSGPSAQGTVIAPGSSPTSPAAVKQAAAKRKAKARKKAKKKLVCKTARQKRTRACKNAAKKKSKQKKPKARKSTARAAATASRSAGFQLKPFAQQTGKTYPAGGDSPLFGITEEDYNRPTCKGAGSFQTWGATAAKTSAGSQELVLLDLYTTELAALVNGRGWAPVTGLCSAHYFDYRDGIVAQGWYEEGARFLDVRDPTDVRQVGYWVPTKGETWSVVYPPTDKTGSIVYALDFARGIDVLKLDRSDLKPRTAPVRRSWLTGAHGRKDGKTALTGLTTASRYGYVCRLAVAAVTG